MILVDFREDSEKKGSHGLWDDLKRTDIELMQGKLDGGDLFFLGKGPGGKEVTVGVEFKKLPDLLSSLRSKRLQGHQLFEMQPYDFRFLLIEGEWRHDDEGFITIRRFRRGQKPSWCRAPGSFRAAELDKTLLGLVLRAGIVVKETTTRTESIRWIQSLYRNFTDMEWDEHTSHTGVHRPTSALVKPSRFVDFVAGIPNVGLKRAKAVESFFKNPHSGKASPRRAIAARAGVWREIDGFGSKLAEQVDNFLEGE